MMEKAKTILGFLSFFSGVIFSGDFKKKGVILKMTPFKRK
jgi:hypothetical protein